MTDSDFLSITQNGGLQTLSRGKLLVCDFAASAFASQAWLNVSACGLKKNDNYTSAPKVSCDQTKKTHLDQYATVGRALRRRRVPRNGQIQTSITQSNQDFYVVIPD